MTALDAIIDLFSRMSASRSGVIFISEEELRRWPKGAVEALQFQQLIVKAHPASSVECKGCEHVCVMPVTTLYDDTGTVSFILCDKRDDLNRVELSPEQLIRWQCNVDLLIDFIVASLKLRHQRRHEIQNDLFEIGMGRGDKRSQMLCLQVNDGLSLSAGDHAIPLTELVEYQEGEYSINRPMIRQMIDSASTADNRYTPSTIKREARKLATQEMHMAWQKEYRHLKRAKPDMSNKWYSLQIAKMEISCGRKAETIRKNMTK